MTARGWGLVAAAAAIGLVVAPWVAPALTLYHTWQYAAALAICAIPLVGLAAGSRGDGEGRAGRAFGLACVGALVVIGAGLWSGLAGADTATIVGTPGTTVPIAGLGAAAGFGPAEPEDLVRGDARVTLRERGRARVLAPGDRRLAGAFVLYLVPRTAAFIEAADAHGAHLTVTQPQNPSFLSPVLLFRETQAIRDRRYPIDTFALPARGLTVRALAFSAADLAAFNHGLASRTGALVLTVSDDAGRPRGIAIAPPGVPTALAGVRVTATIGTYPALAVASAPWPPAVIVGALLFVLGLARALVLDRALTRERAGGLVGSA